jgi:hypothetical protein
VAQDNWLLDFVCVLQSAIGASKIFQPEATVFEIDYGVLPEAKLSPETETSLLRPRPIVVAAMDSL